VFHAKNFENFSSHSQNTVREICVDSKAATMNRTFYSRKSPAASFGATFAWIAAENGYEVLSLSTDGRKKLLPGNGVVVGDVLTEVPLFMALLETPNTLD
jgi:hypothetical protein